MRITSVEITPVRVPLEIPYGETTAVGAVVAQLRTDEGVEGLGHAITLSIRHFRSTAVAAEELGELLVGEDPSQIERLHRKMLPDGGATGGIANGAAAALDVALWDIAGKTAGKPLYQLCGGYRNRIPCYASLRLGRDLPLAKLTETAGSLVDQGFRAMKMNLGGQATLDGDIERVRAVRETIGPDVNLLTDVNFRWTPAQAIRAGHALEEFRLYWFEDPVPTYNLEGLAEVRQALHTPIAAGEALYGFTSFRPLFEARALDVPMPDLVRVGGITPYLKVAHLAETYSLPLACHLLPEISAQVIAGVPNGLIIEFVPFAWPLFRNCPELADGELVMSEQPGHGLELNAEFVKANRVV